MPLDGSQPDSQATVPATEASPAYWKNPSVPTSMQPLKIGE